MRNTERDKQAILEQIEFFKLNIREQLDINFLNFFSNNRPDKELLYEGIFSTYPIETVRKHLINRYNFDDWQVEIIKGENNTEQLVIRVYNTKENKNELDNVLKRCGYYPSYAQVTKDGSTIAIQYEKRIEDDANSLVSKKRFLYHITPSSCVKKILEQGLCPKTKNKKFQYPSRIYLFLNIPQKKISTILAQQLYQYIPQNEYSVKNKLYDTFSLLEIDVNKLGDLDYNYVFYKDPNTEGGVFTVDNIPPHAITVKSSSISAII